MTLLFSSLAAHGENHLTGDTPLHIKEFVLNPWSNF
jgi:hypothetical protein